MCQSKLKTKENLKYHKKVVHGIENPKRYEIINSDMLGKPCGICNENFVGKGIICSNCVTVQIQKDSKVKVIFNEIDSLFNYSSNQKWNAELLLDLRTLLLKMLLKMFA